MSNGRLVRQCIAMVDNGIVYATSAHEVWEDLNKSFDKVNRMTLYQLHREIIYPNY